MPNRVIFALIALLMTFASALSAQEDGATDRACPPDFAGYLAPRLTVDEWARVAPGTPLNFRPDASTDQARLAQINPGETVQISAGPLCNAGYIWWQVTYEGRVGWLAEGVPAGGINGTITENTYWLEPRGALIAAPDGTGSMRFYVRDADGFIEPEGCLVPSEDYTRQQLGYATLNTRTLTMLDQAQRVYETYSPAGPVNFRQAITQGSYNPGGVSASFGTHDAGGAVDISVRSALDWSVLSTEIDPMIDALRTAGFAAWLRDTGSLYADSPIHIHAIAVGDAELSPIARAQIDGERGYLRGYNGLPEDYGPPIPDEHGGPIICGWMRENGWGDQRDLSAEDYFSQAVQQGESGDLGAMLVTLHTIIAQADPVAPLTIDYLLARGDLYMSLNQPTYARLDYERVLEIAPENAEAQARLATLESAS